MIEHEIWLVMKVEQVGLPVGFALTEKEALIAVDRLRLLHQRELDGATNWVQPKYYYAVRTTDNLSDGYPFEQED